MGFGNKTWMYGEKKGKNKGNRTKDAPIVFMRKSFSTVVSMLSVIFVLNEVERKELPFRLFRTDRVNGGT